MLKFLLQLKFGHAKVQEKPAIVVHLSRGQIFYILATLESGNDMEKYFRTTIPESKNVTKRITCQDKIKI